MDAEFFQRVEAVRRFNRFYTRQIGLLEEGLLDSPFSLTEARVIYELAHQEGVTASALSGQLGVDPGYLSRILRGFNRRGLVEKVPSSSDARQSRLHLTEAGQAAFAALNASSKNEVGTMLGKLPVEAQNRLTAAMQVIERILGGPAERAQAYLLRPPQPGDMGWVIHRHGTLYAQEYGWDERFEALVASIAAEFVQHHDPSRERCWIAEMDGEIVGSVFLVKKSETVAKLRLLLVEPKARGLGIGRRLVEECIRFARQAGYQTLTLWTNSVLTAARQIYASAGFRLVESEPQPNFGKDLVGETWELAL